LNSACSFAFPTTHSNRIDDELMKTWPATFWWPAKSICYCVYLLTAGPLRDPLESGQIRSSTTERSHGACNGTGILSTIPDPIRVETPGNVPSERTPDIAELKFFSAH
jgi:hypothetical protein